MNKLQGSLCRTWCHLRQCAAWWTVQVLASDVLSQAKELAKQATLPCQQRFHLCRQVILACIDRGHHCLSAKDSSALTLLDDAYQLITEHLVSSGTCACLKGCSRHASPHTGPMSYKCTSAPGSCHTPLHASSYFMSSSSNTWLLYIQQIAWPVDALAAAGAGRG